MRIAIDAMGGDHAPELTVKGAIQAAQEWSDTEIVLVGDSGQIEQFLTVRPSNVHIHHTEEVIESDEEPVRAVRRKKDASMVVAGQMVKDRRADAMVSAGNTGALMAVGLLVVGRIKGIQRPALAFPIPTLDGKGVLALDLGANMDATAEQLAQYAHMGSIYRHHADGFQSPRVGLLNVGTEAMKGNEVTKQAFPLFEQLPIQFVGNVEARDLLTGNCDVLVCDGFAGNILLKSMEGTQKAIFSVLKTELRSSFMTKIAGLMIKPKLRAFKKFDYREHGGAPLLGIDGVVIKGHGSSDAGAFKNAIRQARSAVQSQLVDVIRAEIKGSEDQV